MNTQPNKPNKHQVQPRLFLEGSYLPRRARARARTRLTTASPVPASLRAVRTGAARAAAGTGAVRVRPLVCGRNTVAVQLGGPGKEKNSLVCSQPAREPLNQSRWLEPPTEIDSIAGLGGAKCIGADAPALCGASDRRVADGDSSVRRKLGYLSVSCGGCGMTDIFFKHANGKMFFFCRPFFLAHPHT